MRFGLPSDSSDEDDLISLASSFTSDSGEDNEGEGRAGPSKPRASSQFGRSIKAYIDTDSESEDTSPKRVDSEEEDIFNPDVITIGSRPQNGTGKSKPRSRKSRGKMKAAPPISWSSKNRSGDAMSALLGEELGINWSKVTEEMALREGQRLARDRSSQLRTHLDDVRAELREAQGMKDTAAADEISKLLEGMALRSAKEEEEAARRFAEREKRLWADIDAAIFRSEQLASDARRALQDAEEKKKSEAAAKLAVEQKAAQEKQAAEQQRAREAVEKSQKEQEAARKLEDERKKVEAAKREAGSTKAEWSKWVEVQSRMKKEVIEVVKAGGKAKLRAGMRLITRGLGQAVNSRESVVKLTEELCAILNPLLSAPPSPASPTSTSSAPAYLYLLSHIAKALIKQAENEIAAKSEAAFPLASIIVGLLLRGHAALGGILFARLVKKCPWVVPYYPSRAANQPRAEYEKSTGQGADESTADYIVRMGGILTLYFGVLQTPLPPLISTLSSAPTPDQLITLIPQPLRLPAAWTWVTHISKEPLRGTPAAAHLLNTWVNIAAPALADVYGPQQVGKILRAIKEEGVDGGLVKGDTESSRQQLGLAVESWRAGTYPAGRSWEN